MALSVDEVARQLVAMEAALSGRVAAAETEVNQLLQELVTA